MRTGEFIKKANHLKRIGKLDEAIAVYQEAIEVNPNFPWYYYELGDALEKQDRWEEAIREFKKAIQINPEFDLARKAIADYYYKLKIKVVDESSYLNLLDQNLHHLENLEKIIVKCGENLQGNCIYRHQTLVKESVLINKQRNIYALAKISNAILEIGFNGGHSALIMLLANPDAKIVSFDICCHKYVIPCFEYLSKHFPSRIELVSGNYLQSLPEYIRKFPERKFDLFHIDGDHSASVANTDFQNCLKISHYGSYVIWDDVNIEALKKLWDQYIDEGYVREIQGLLPTGLYPHAVGQCCKSEIYLGYSVKDQSNCKSEEISVSENFDEDLYLALNDDVRMAVANGGLKSGYEHWLMSGKEEEALGKRPKHLYPPPRKNQGNSPSEGVLYIATGKQHIQEAVYSVSSLKKHMPHVHATIFLNETINDQSFDEVVMMTELEVRQPQRYRYVDKVFYMNQSPYKKTLFLDTDTYICSDCSELFAILERFDLAASHAPCRNGDSYNGVPASFVQMNTGVILFKRNPLVKEFFLEWLRLYKKECEEKTTPLSWDQSAFREALFKSKLKFCTLTPEYNYRFIFPTFAQSEVKILHGRHPNLPEIASQINSKLVCRTSKLDGDGLLIDYQVC
jgi:tetratricopeptide (TPR) repeat protein